MASRALLMASLVVACAGPPEAAGAVAASTTPSAAAPAGEPPAGVTLAAGPPLAMEAPAAVCSLCGYWLTPLRTPVLRDGVLVLSELGSFRFLGDSIVLRYVPFRPDRWGLGHPRPPCVPPDSVYRFRAWIEDGWLHFENDFGDDVTWAEIDGDRFVDRPAPGIEYPVVRVPDAEAPLDSVLADLVAERPLFSCPTPDEH